MIRTATKADHEAIMAIARSHKALSSFGHMMFSSDAIYAKGWIRVWHPSEHPHAVGGFTCFRHKVRQPETSLYYIGVKPILRGSGMGEDLIDDLKKQSPHHRIVLNVLLDNEGARRFYARLGFREEGPSLGGKGVKLALEWT